MNAQPERRSFWRWLASMEPDQQVRIDRWTIVFLALTVGTAVFAIKGSLVGLTATLLVGIGVTLLALATRRGEA
jgi:hypothetical protein